MTEPDIITTLGFLGGVTVVIVLVCSAVAWLARSGCAGLSAFVIEEGED